MEYSTEQYQPDYYKMHDASMPSPPPTPLKVPLPAMMDPKQFAAHQAFFYQYYQQQQQNSRLPAAMPTMNAIPFFVSPYASEDGFPVHHAPFMMMPIQNPQSVPIPHEAKIPKIFKCTNAHCSKIYKNSNGLKYHLEKGQCERNVCSDHDDELPDTDSSIKVAHRPYLCKVEKCGKRYKNLNGLKYHAKKTHPELDFKADIKLHRTAKRSSSSSNDS